MTLTTETRPSPADLARSIAANPQEWIGKVRLDVEDRWYLRLQADEDREVWLISWLPGQSTGLHDHGESRGAFAVALGELAEHDLGGVRQVGSGQVRSFGTDYVHDVCNESRAPAVSVHVYSPPLSSMRRYDRDGEGNLVELAREVAGDW